MLLCSTDVDFANQNDPQWETSTSKAKWSWLVRVEGWLGHPRLCPQERRQPQLCWGVAQRRIEPEADSWKSHDQEQLAFHLCLASRECQVFDQMVWEAFFKICSYPEGWAFHSWKNITQCKNCWTALAVESSEILGSNWGPLVNSLTALQISLNALQRWPW